MNKQPLSLMSCVVNTALSRNISEILERLRLPSVYMQRGKQLCLEEHSGFPGFRRRVRLAEDRADIFRFLIPLESERALASAIAESADLYLPGRGALYAETVEAHSSCLPDFSASQLSGFSEKTVGLREGWSLVCCIVQRGGAEALARTILEMGLCVPIVSFGEGVGNRGRLGLLRITIPVDKEIIYMLVPSREAVLAEGVLTHKARLNLPGMGFVYRHQVRVYAVNLRASRGQRTHLASMDQVIAALDELRGSSDWRRTAASPSAAGQAAVSARRRTPAAGDAKDDSPWVRLSIQAEDTKAVDLARLAMGEGAGGATLVPLSYTDYRIAATERAEVRGHGHAWGNCDLVLERGLLDRVLSVLSSSSPESCDVNGNDTVICVSPVDSAVTCR